MLTLRDMITDDLDPVATWRSDPTVNCYLSDRLKTRPEVESWFERVKAKPKVWVKVIMYLDSPVGYAAVESIDEQSRKCEIAMVIGEVSVWGKGIGTSVSRTMLDYAFRELHLHRVVAVVIRGNERSERMIKWLGFVYEGSMREAMLISGKFHDLLWYGMLESEYLDHRTKPKEESE